MRDLENGALFDCVAGFAGKMKSARDHFAQSEKMHYSRQKSAWFLDGVDVYLACVRELHSGISASLPSSEGFLEFSAYLFDYVTSAAFRRFPKTFGLGDILARRQGRGWSADLQIGRG